MAVDLSAKKLTLMLAVKIRIKVSVIVVAGNIKYLVTSFTDWTFKGALWVSLVNNKILTYFHIQCLILCIFFLIFFHICKSVFIIFISIMDS